MILSIDQAGERADRVGRKREGEVGGVLELEGEEE